MAERLYLSFPSDTGFVATLEDFYYEFIETSCADEHFDADDVFLSLVEAVVNAIKHGNKCDMMKKVDIEILKDNHDLKVTIKDEGAGFDPMNVKDPTLPECLPVPGGRGVFLIRKLMDEVAYDFSGVGTKLVMIKHANTK